MTAIIFGWESLKVALSAPNVMELLKEHHEELGVHKAEIPLDPDFDGYRALEECGRLRAFTARADGRLVGYITYVLGPALHYRSSYHAVEDLIFLEPEHRRGGLGSRLLIEGEKAVLELARAAGYPYVRFMNHIKRHHDEAREGGMSRFYARHGYEHTDSIVCKVVKTDG